MTTPNQPIVIPKRAADKLAEIHTALENIPAHTFGLDWHMFYSFIGSSYVKKLDTYVSVYLFGDADNYAEAGKLLGLLDYLAAYAHPKTALTRPLLGDLLSQATQVEEFLDSHDAGKNCQWCLIRSLTATIRHRRR